MRGPLGEHMAETLADRDAHERLGLDPSDGRRLLTAFARHDPRMGWAQLWARFVLVEWYRRVALDVAMPTARERVRA
jgi:hypothetical protein